MRWPYLGGEGGRAVGPGGAQVAQGHARAHARDGDVAAVGEGQGVDEVLHGDGEGAYVGCDEEAVLGGGGGVGRGVGLGVGRGGGCERVVAAVGTAAGTAAETAAAETTAAGTAAA